MNRMMVAVCDAVGAVKGRANSEASSGLEFYSMSQYGGKPQDVREKPKII